ncbi:MAG: protein kinase [Actinomycetota bacterium]|nr:protein kinase [Actinomycetota bacterium]
MGIAPRLKAGTRLRSDHGTTYQVVRPLGQGGFATTYAGRRLSRNGRPGARVCIKVCRDLYDWHGEAFFGRLLQDNPRVVRLRDAFVASTGSGSSQRRRHVLVFDYMAEGTVWEMLETQDKPWTEARVRREIKALLNVLMALHHSGATHRDLKPDNVYLRTGKLVLGDFGITKMRLDPTHSFVSEFAPDFAPSNVLRSFRWAEADDVFQVGLLAATLLSGEVWWTDSVSVQAIGRLPASDEFKSWIWHATGARSKRYWDAGDAIDALDSLRHISLTPARAPRSLKGHSVVFTGRLDGLTRAQAGALARAAGATPQAGVGDATSVIVVGRPARGMLGASEGRNLFAARERLRLGQQIRIISPVQFHRLTQGVRP